MDLKIHIHIELGRYQECILGKANTKRVFNIYNFLKHLRKRSNQRWTEGKRYNIDPMMGMVAPSAGYRGHCSKQNFSCL